MRKLTSHESQRLGLALILVAAATVFWTLFEQAGSSLNLFAERNTQLPNDGFFTINAAQTQSFNSGFILLFAPVFAALWTAWRSQARSQSDAEVWIGHCSGRLRLLHAHLGRDLCRWRTSRCRSSS